MAQKDDVTVITLSPGGPLHVGLFIGEEREAALEWVPSDTLFAALVSAWAALDLDVPALLQGFREGDPPFLLTSAFPRAGAVRFYPRPWLRPRPAGLLERKRAKRLRWVSEGIFRRLLGGESLQGEDDDQNFLHEGKVWLTRTERDLLPEAVLAGEGLIWKHQVVPHVAVDRRENRSNLFHAGRVEFAAGCGLWFGLRWRRPETLSPDLVDRALDYLGQAGLGGLRSIGHGAFAWEKEESSLPSAQGPLAITLSRYAPCDASELGETLLGDPHTAYRLVLVGGWCRDDALHPWRRRSLRLVAEGSLLAWDGRSVAGHLVDVTPQGVGAFGPNHRVLRYGYAFPATVNSKALAEEELP